MNLVPLYEEAIQFNNFNGTVLAAGKVEVWYLGRTRKADIYADVAGETPLPNPFDLNDLGMQEVYVNPAFNYTLVVCDPYGAELFSVDKYLQGAGAHTTSNVVVQPSENIGVSAWTVGEVQIYQPYLVGEVGKIYEGIEPIVVNNDVNRISANHVPLGVQDPLYFVQDDEEGCILGCSAQTEIPAELSGKWDEASDAVIANSAQWAEGTEYEAGSYIDIDGHTISVTGLQPEGDYAYNSALSSKLDVTALPQDLVHSGDLTAYYPIDNPSGFITGVDLTDYATTAQLDEKLDKTDSGNFYPMEGNPSGFLTAHQSLQGYATEQWVEDKGYLTGVDIPESATWNATTQTVSANSAQWAGGTANPQIPVTGINGIKISESGDKVVFEVSADYALADDLTGKQDSLTFGYKDTAISSIDNSALYDNSAHARITTLAGRISDLSSNKLDTAIYAEDSGKFLTAHQSLAGYATENWVTSQGYLTAETDWSDTITAASANAYNEATAAIPTGLATEDWVTAQGYLTAHQSLADYQTTADMVNYQTTAGMTAYQPAGDYMTTADSANFYTTANESGFISEVPAGTMNESAFGYDENDKISGYNGSAFAGGSDVPEGVMVESGLEYNAVNEISGYNGSAIAQYGAEKQWLVHDDTLVHASNSAQYALGVNLSAVAQLLGVDETVLWSGTATSITSVNLSETLSNFKRARITFNPYTSTTSMPKEIKEFLPEENKKILSLTQFVSPGILNLFKTEFSYAGTTFNIESQYYFDGKWTSANNNSQLQLYEVVGIGRKQ